MEASYSEVFRHSVRNFPDKLAVSIDRDEITDSDLARRVDAARAAIGAHAGVGDRVAIWLPNSIGWVAAFVAAAEMGVITVPLNTRLTTAELRVILEDAGARVLLTSRNYRGRRYLEEALDGIPADLMPVILEVASDEAGGGWEAHVRQPVGAPDNRDDLRDIFCIQYTSGTTSTPKGVMLRAEAYLRTARYVASCQGVVPSTSFMSAGPFFHCSGSMHAITTCLAAGASLHSMSVWDPETLLDLVEHYKATVSHAIFFRDVVALGAARARPKLASLRVGHDIAGPNLLMQLHDEFGITGISNIYGMTETCGQFTMWYPDDALEKRVSGNGRTQAGNHIRVADPITGDVLAAGMQGEVQMKGPTITPGYFNRPSANRDAFTDDGWLRSGDLGQLTEAGELRYVARLKDIIRVGGENLAPAEVEQAFRDVCDVSNICVLGIHDSRLQEVPVAAVIPGESCDWPAIMGALRQRLAGFKVPTQIYTATELPMTMTNKVQRAKVRSMIEKGELTRVL
jgi:acyl-CoA synthetase (AMP-forming)/AMP-acid ligase II